MASTLTATAFLFLGIICFGQLPATATETSGSSITSNLDGGSRGGGEYDEDCDGNCCGAIIAIDCCTADGPNSCCGNIASGNSVLNCAALDLSGLNVIGGIGAALVAGLCGESGAMCSGGSVCIAKIDSLLSNDESKDNDSYCCYAYDTLQNAYVCKNSADKDVLMHCAKKGNTTNRNSTSIARGGEQANTQAGGCCSYTQCSDFSSNSRQ